MNQLFNALGNSSNPLKPSLGSTQQQSPLSQMSHLMEFIKTTSPEQAKAQVNQLQLQSALCGVVRYPNSTTFTAGYNPYFNANACGCGTTF